VTELSHALFTVRDRNRVLEFDGELLGQSSSRTRNSLRWVEFFIYRTSGREYVLSRVGLSAIYHALECALLQSDAIPPIALPEANSVPCPMCRPDENDRHPFRPETPRYFARVYESPVDLVNGLYRESADGRRYLTHVARTALEAASRADPRLRPTA
jgi:hypothetical protein